jgi:uncharacterized lipoprotein YddW (UPF0748 family)
MTSSRALRRLTLATLLLLVPGCASSNHATDSASAKSPPASPREFRAAWVATVGNSTWPSRRDLSVEDQKKEMLAILDRAVALRLNAIIFQVRTQCDALYDSRLEPWSEFLTGAEGKPPSPYWDPLATWIDEAHKRGLALHAWFNPYRAKSGNAKGDRAANHVSHLHPEIVRTYGNQLWLDPGDPATIDYSLAVFMDVVKRYDIDGVHIDDYFYPYKISERSTSGPTTRQRSSTTRWWAASRSSSRPTSRFAGRGGGRSVDFPDEITWKRYQQSGGKLSRNDWRRQNVNTFIERLYNSIKSEKKWVKFGISPFGIWRPGNPAGVEGLDAYDQLYADSRLWFSKGWCDYFTPQLYWPIEGHQSFPALFKWWSEQNDAKRYLWPGIAIGRRDAAETIKQIQITRTKPNPGVVHWSMGSLMRRKELDDALSTGLYSQSALIPASTWLDHTPPPKPSATATARLLRITPTDGEQPWLWSIYIRNGGKWTFMTAPAAQREVVIPANADSVVITAVDRCGNESDRVTMRL